MKIEKILFVLVWLLAVNLFTLFGIFTFTVAISAPPVSLLLLPGALLSLFTAIFFFSVPFLPESWRKYGPRKRKK